MVPPSYKRFSKAWETGVGNIPEGQRLPWQAGAARKFGLGEAHGGWGVCVCVCGVIAGLRVRIWQISHEG